MLVIQQNCRKKYECIIFVLEVGLSLEAVVICIQELFLKNQSLLHSGFNLYWLARTKNWKDIQVLTTEQKNIVNEVIVENQKKPYQPSILYDLGSQEALL